MTADALFPEPDPAPVDPARSHPYTGTGPYCDACGLPEGNARHTITRLSFFAHGDPTPQGSKRHVGNGIMVESSKRARPWRDAVRFAAIDALAGRRTPFPHGTPVAGVFVFRIPRPAAHYGTGRNQGVIRPSAPAFPIGHHHPGDIDKLLRATCDALTEASVWGDDSQLVDANALKVYGPSSGCLITLTVALRGEHRG